MTDLAMPAAMPATTPDTEFAELFTAYRTRVQALIAQRLHPDDKHLAEDLTAETFTSVWITRRNGGRAIEQPFALLATVAKRRICDHYRKAERRISTTPVDAGEWQITNRAYDPAGGYYTPAATGFRTAPIGGQR